MNTTITGFRIYEIEDENKEGLLRHDCKEKTLFDCKDLNGNLTAKLYYNCLVKLKDYITIRLEMFSRKKIREEKERKLEALRKGENDVSNS